MDILFDQYFEFFVFKLAAVGGVALGEFAAEQSGEGKEEAEKERQSVDEAEESRQGRQVSAKEERELAALMDMFAAGVGDVSHFQQRLQAELEALEVGPQGAIGKSCSICISACRPSGKPSRWVPRVLLSSCTPCSGACRPGWKPSRWAPRVPRKTDEPLAAAPAGLTLSL